jgi:tetratricopeptide (TPR) repeat protein
MASLLRSFSMTAAVALAAAGAPLPAQAPPAVPEEGEILWSQPSHEQAMLVEALEHLRKWEMIAADEILSEICPEITDGVAEGTTLEDLSCAARAVSFGEVKGAKDASDRADGYWWGGERARRTKRADLSRAFFEVALERNPKDSDAWTSLGRLRRDTGDLPGSNDALRKAMEIDSKNLEAAYWLAANRMDQSDGARAEELLQGILAKDKKYGKAYYRLGLLRQKQGRHEEAIGLLEKAKANGVDAKVVRERIDESRKALPPKPR